MVWHVDINIAAGNIQYTYEDLNIIFVLWNKWYFYVKAKAVKDEMVSQN